MGKVNYYDQKLVNHVLQRVAAPHYVDLTSPFIGDSKVTVRVNGQDYAFSREREGVLDSVLEKAKASLSAFDSRLCKFEEQELKKAGPMSIRPDTTWWDKTISSYESYPQLSIDMDSLSKAQDAVFSIVGPAMSKGYFMNLSQVSFPHGTFSGLPWCTKSEKVLDELLDMSREMVDQLSRGEFINPYPSIMGWRGQSKGMYDIPKQRVVWMYPKAPVVVSLSWLRTVVPHLRTLREFVGWRPVQDIDSEILRALDTASAIKSNVISMDFSAFDTTITPILVRPYFERLRLGNMLLPLLDDFFNSSLLYPNGILHRHHGVPSGHGWTNFIDCLANLTCIYYIAARHGVNVQFATALGDDSVCVYSSPVELELMSKYASELGLKLNADKSLSSMDEAHFLQRYYLRGKSTGGIRSIIRTLNHIITFERWHNEMSSSYLEARTWSQLNEVEFNPARNLLLDWVLKHDREHLRLDQPNAAREISRVISESDLSEKSRWQEGYSVPTSFWFA